MLFRIPAKSVAKPQHTRLKSSFLKQNPAIQGGP
jgi:hypothetical protein